MQHALKIQKQKQLYRELKLPEYQIDFFSNDYLGLARNKKFISACQRERSFLPIGATGSRLISGNYAYAEEFEKQLAEMQGFEASLLFQSGYVANLALFSALLQKGDVLLFDQDVHASMRDGMRLSTGSCYPYRHLNLNHLEERLRHIPCSKTRYIATESLFSTDGKFADLAGLQYLSKKYNARLIFDEAHSFGVCGENGLGFHKDCPEAYFAILVTFSKALGSQGAALLLSNELKDYLLNFSRPCIYSTFLSPHQVAAMRTAYKMLPELSEERETLSILKRRLNAESHIHTIPMQDATEALSMQEKLLSRGIAVGALRPPTVRKGRECLRVCLHAFNSSKEVALLYG